MNIASTCTSLKNTEMDQIRPLHVKRFLYELARFSKTQQHTTALNIAISFIHIDRNKKNDHELKDKKKMLTYLIY